MTNDAYNFGDTDALLSRLESNPRECVFLLGSPLTASETPTGPGVPTVSEIVHMIIERLGSVAKDVSSLKDALATNPANAYQEAFSALYFRNSSLRDRTQRH